MSLKIREKGKEIWNGRRKNIVKFLKSFNLRYHLLIISYFFLLYIFVPFTKHKKLTKCATLQKTT